MARRNGTSGKLTAKQQRFVEEYLVDPNGTQEAIRAGYSPKVAHVQGSRLLSNDKVKAAIHETNGKRMERVKVDEDWVITQLVENLQRARQETPVPWIAMGRRVAAIPPTPHQ